MHFSIEYFPAGLNSHDVLEPELLECLFLLGTAALHAEQKSVLRFRASVLFLRLAALFQSAQQPANLTVYDSVVDALCPKSLVEFAAQIDRSQRQGFSSMAPSLPDQSSSATVSDSTSSNPSLTSQISTPQIDLTNPVHAMLKSIAKSSGLCMS